MLLQSLEHKFSLSIRIGLTYINMNTDYLAIIHGSDSVQVTDQIGGSRHGTSTRAKYVDRICPTTAPRLQHEIDYLFHNADA